MYPFKIKINIRFYESSLFLKGVFAKNEKWYRLTAKNNRFCMLLILFLSVSSMRRKFKLLSVLLFQLFLSSSFLLVHVRLLLILRTIFSFFHRKKIIQIFFCLFFPSSGIFYLFYLLFCK